METLRALDSHGIEYYYATTSALDRYFHVNSNQNVYMVVKASLIDLARSLGELEYPGLEQWDAALRSGEGAVYFRCLEEEEAFERQPSFAPLSFLYDPRRDAFLDPADVYGTLRSEHLVPNSHRARGAARMIADAAVLASRYGYRIDLDALPPPDDVSDLPPELQRQLLIDVLTGTSPHAGLDLLMHSGFVERFWPDLAPMNSTDHTKEFHPEGNVWDHTLETFRYRKTLDLTLGMTLLLHDVGKPFSAATRERRFDSHANIGRRKVRGFLLPLGFSEEFVDTVSWLVRHHMFPALIHKLPVARSKSIMASELFPLLLEVYRCDLASTFQGPEDYYRACKTYRQFLKNHNNPFRAADGRKLVHLYVD